MKSTFELFEIKEDEVFCHKGEFMGGQLTCEKCGEKYEVHFHLKELKVQRLTVKIDDNIPKEMIFYSN